MRRGPRESANVKSVHRKEQKYLFYHRRRFPEKKGPKADDGEIKKEGGVKGEGRSMQRETGPLLKNVCLPYHRKKNQTGEGKRGKRTG